MLTVVILSALIFKFINGFHDTANAIATSVATRVLSPRRAIALAAVMNLIGALLSGAVATTIAYGLVESSVVTLPTLMGAGTAAGGWKINKNSWV
jgi:PiT family inorganic phosphate transporter